MKHPYFLPEKEEEFTEYCSFFHNEREKELFRMLCLNWCHIFIDTILECSRLEPSKVCLNHVKLAASKLSFKLSNKDLRDTAYYVLETLVEIKSLEKNRGCGLPK